jgi:hypothetical protein
LKRVLRQQLDGAFANTVEEFDENVARKALECFEAFPAALDLSARS